MTLNSVQDTFIFPLPLHPELSHILNFNLRYMCLGISVTVVTVDGRWEDLIKIKSNLIARNEEQGNLRNIQATP